MKIYYKLVFRQKGKAFYSVPLYVFAQDKKEAIILIRGKIDRTRWTGLNFIND